jgi:hypothetical protein
MLVVLLTGEDPEMRFRIPLQSNERGDEDRVGQIVVQIVRGDAVVDAEHPVKPALYLARIGMKVLPVSAK